MWPHTFGDRLASWSNLRCQCTTADLDIAVTAINQWWFNTRGLGILYTIAILDRKDLQNAVLLEVGSDNLVLLDTNKYIMNWDRDTVVNINPGPIIKSQHQITQNQIKLQIK